MVPELLYVAIIKFSKWYFRQFIKLRLYWRVFIRFCFSPVLSQWVCRIPSNMVRVIVFSIISIALPLWAIYNQCELIKYFWLMYDVRRIYDFFWHSVVWVSVAFDFLNSSQPTPSYPNHYPTLPPPCPSIRSNCWFQINNLRELSILRFYWSTHWGLTFCRDICEGIFLTWWFIAQIRSPRSQWQHLALFQIMAWRRITHKFIVACMNHQASISTE